MRVPRLWRLQGAVVSIGEEGLLLRRRSSHVLRRVLHWPELVRRVVMVRVRQVGNPEALRYTVRCGAVAKVTPCQTIPMWLLLLPVVVLDLSFAMQPQLPLG